VNNESNSSSPHIPLALLACTIVVILISQVGASSQSKNFMEWQSKTLEKQIAQMQQLDKQAHDAIENRKEMVKKSGELQNQFQSLLNDLLELADKDKDKDAQEIIAKWNVKRAAQGAPAAADAGEKKP